MLEAFDLPKDVAMTFVTRWHGSCHLPKEEEFMKKRGQRRASSKGECDRASAVNQTAEDFLRPGKTKRGIVAKTPKDHRD